MSTKLISGHRSESKDPIFINMYIQNDKKKIFTCTFCRYVPAFPGSRGVTLSCLEPENMATHYNACVRTSFRNKRLAL